MSFRLNCKQQRHAAFRCLALAVWTVIIGGCASSQSTRNQALQSKTTDAAVSPSKPSSGSPSQQHLGLQPPAAATEAVVTARVKSWQQDCDRGKYADGQPQQPQFRITGQGWSVFALRRTNNVFIASTDISSADGKTLVKGALIQMRTLGVGGVPVTSTVLSGVVWTPRASVIGKLDLTGSGKITTRPDFSFDAFKDSPAVIPFANGYAVNLFGQKLDEEGLVDTNTRLKASYVSDDGRPLYGRLVRSRLGKLEEIILAP